MPAITCWSRSSECSGRGAASSSREVRRVRPRLRPERARARRRPRRLRAQQLHPRRLPGAELAQPQLAVARAAAASTRDVRSCIERALVEQLQPPGAHQVHQQRQAPAGVESMQQLAAPAHARDRRAVERVQRRVERLQRVDARRQRGLDRARRPAPRRGGGRRSPSRAARASPIDGSVAWPAMDDVGRRSARRRSPAARRASWRRSSPSPRPRATSTAPRSARRSCAALLPDDAELERVPCSSPDHARRPVARLRGSGTRADAAARPPRHRRRARRPPAARARRRQARRLGHGRHEGRRRALARRAARARRAAARTTPRSRCCSSATRSGGPRRSRHVERFAGFDACLCFEGGERTPDGEEGVVVRRKAAGTLRVRAHGPRRALGLRARPRAQRAARARRGRAGRRGLPRPERPDHLTAVPTVLHAGDAFNVVPGDGELICDMRADSSRRVRRA